MPSIQEALKGYMMSRMEEYHTDFVQGRPVHMTRDLMRFLDVPEDRELTSAYVYQRLNIYIRDNNLRRGVLISLDEHLANLLGTETGSRVGLLTIQLLLQKHMLPHNKDLFREEIMEDIQKEAMVALRAL